MSECGCVSKAGEARKPKHYNDTGYTIGGTTADADHHEICSCSCVIFDALNSLLLKEEVHARYILACLISLESSRITDPILAMLYDFLVLRRGQTNQIFLKPDHDETSFRLVVTRKSTMLP